MTPCQRLAVIHLADVSFGMARASRRFARDIAAMPEAFELSAYQAGFLWRLCWTYRRQLPAAVVELAKTLKEEPLPPRPEKPRRSDNRRRVQWAADALSRPLKFGDPEQIRVARSRAKGISHA